MLERDLRRSLLDAGLPEKVEDRPVVAKGRQWTREEWARIQEGARPLYYEERTHGKIDVDQWDERPPSNFSIPLRICGLIVSFTVDSGSDRTLIDLNTWRRIPVRRRPELISRNEIIHGCGHSSMRSYGDCIMTIYTPEHDYTLVITIIEGNGVPAILGNNLITALPHSSLVTNGDNPPVTLFFLNGEQLRTKLHQDGSTRGPPATVDQPVRTMCMVSLGIALPRLGSLVSRWDAE